MRRRPWELGGVPAALLMQRGGGAHPPPRSSLLNNLVSYWKLNEASGTAADSAGTDTLTANNSPVGGPGKIGNCRVFVGASLQYLSGTTIVRSTVQAWTVAGWVWRNALQSNFWGNAQTAGAFQLFKFQTDSSAILTNNANAAATFTISPSVAQSAWHHVAVTSNGAGNVSLYVDGVSQGTQSFSCELGLRVLADAGLGNNTLDGKLDEVGVWAVALSAAQIARLWNGGAGVTYPFTGVP